MLTKLLPYLIPFIIGCAIGGSAALGITKAVKPEIKLECPACPSLTCPPVPPSNGIDFDKVKGRNVTIENHQYFVMDRDTLSVDVMKKIFRDVAQEQKLSRCK